MLIKLETFSHLSHRSFGLGSSIRLEYLSNALPHSHIRCHLPHKGALTLTRVGKLCFSEREYKGLRNQLAWQSQRVKPGTYGLHTGHITNKLPCNFSTLISRERLTYTTENKYKYKCITYNLIFSIYNRFLYLNKRIMFHKS